MELNPTSYVILGMLGMRPMCGYEIKALVDGSTRFFWAASYGQIYPELRRLTEAGLIEDPHRAIDWLSTFPQVVLAAIGERP